MTGAVLFCSTCDVLSGMFQTQFRFVYCMLNPVDRPLSTNIVLSFCRPVVFLPVLFQIVRFWVGELSFGYNLSALPFPMSWISVTAGIYVLGRCLTGGLSTLGIFMARLDRVLGTIC